MYKCDRIALLQSPKHCTFTTGHKSSLDSSSSACQRTWLANSASLLPLVPTQFDNIRLFQNPIFRRRFSLFGHTGSGYRCSTNDDLILTCASRVGNPGFFTKRSKLRIRFGSYLACLGRLVPAYSGSQRWSPGSEPWAAPVRGSCRAAG